MTFDKQEVIGIYDIIIGEIETVRGEMESYGGGVTGYYLGQSGFYVKRLVKDDVKNCETAVLVARYYNEVVVALVVEVIGEDVKDVPESDEAVVFGAEKSGQGESVSKMFLDEVDVRVIVYIQFTEGISGAGEVCG